MAEDGHPRIYQFVGRNQPGWLAAALVIVAIGVAAGAVMQRPDLWVSACGWLLASPIIAFGLAGVFATVRGRLLLYPDRAEYTGVLATRVIPNAEVRGVRYSSQAGFLGIKVVMKDGRKIHITDFGRADAALRSWLRRFPDEEKRLSVKRGRALKGNKAFGATPEERKAAIARDSAWISQAMFASYGITLWGIFYPHPHVVCAILAMAVPPACALAVLWSRGRWALLDGKDAGRLSLSQATYGPIVVLVMRALHDSPPLDLYMPLTAGLGVGAGMAVLIVAIERGFRPVAIALCLVGCCCYALPSLMLLNAMLDQAPAKIGLVRILDMRDRRDSHGRHEAYELYLTPWGPYRQVFAYDVSSRFYHSLQIGSNLCVYSYPGVFGWRHIHIDRCPSD